MAQRGRPRKVPLPVEEAPQQPSAEMATPPVEEVKEPVQTSFVEFDIPPPPKVLTPADLEAQRIAGLDAQKKAFYDKVMEARRKPEVVQVKQDIPERVMKQTEAEMAEGRRMNEYWAAQQGRRVIMPPKPEVTAVFRPEDYVPNMKQGNIKATNLG